MATSWIRAILLLLAMLGVTATGDESEQKQEEEPAAPEGKVQLVQDLNGHSGHVIEMVFGLGDKRLYTAGAPGDVMEWRVASGVRKRVWRFPGLATRLATSSDGARLAVGTRDGERGFVWLIDLKSTVSPRLVLRTPKPVSRMALAPDGKRLAVEVEGETQIHDVQTGKRTAAWTSGVLRTLTFDATGRKVLTASSTGPHGNRVQVHDVSDPGKAVSVKLPSIHRPKGKAAPDMREARAAWSSNGLRVGAIAGMGSPHVQIWPTTKSARGHEYSREQLAKELQVGGKDDWRPVGMRFLSKKEKAKTPGALVACWAVGGRLVIAHIDPHKKNAITRMPSDIRVQFDSAARVAFSRNGRYLAVTTDPGSQIALYDLRTRKGVRKPVRQKNEKVEMRLFRMGPSVTPPRTVAWTKEGYGISWGERIGKEKRPAGLNLKTMMPLGAEDELAAETGKLPAGWKLSSEKSGKAFLLQKEKKIPLAVSKIVPDKARVYKDEAGKLRLLLPHNQGHRLSILDPDTGKVVASIGRVFYPVYDLAVSPDQKYVVVAGGNVFLRVFSLRDKATRVLSVLPYGQDWIAWTARGYYAGTPGGEKLIGWKVLDGADKPAAFHSVRHFRKQLYRPDLISLVLEKGSVTAALEAVAKESGKPAPRAVKSVDELLPPSVVIESVDKTKLPQVTMKVKASASSKTQPVTSLRLLLNGRPLPEEKFLINLEKGKSEHTQDWTVEVPEGTTELSVLVRGPDSMAVSTEKVVEWKSPPAARLFSLCIGVDNYAQSALNLKAAGNDARAIAAAIEKRCIKPLFASASAQLLLDEKATKKNVLDALAQMRAKSDGTGAIKATDLLVVFFAGHGVKTKDEFYLLPHDAKADKPENIPGSCISGAELRKALTAFPCQVLLLLDACHSGAAGRALGRPATDEATRAMTDEEVGVVVLAAAMGHEFALEAKAGKAQRGFFALAVEEAISRKPGVPFNFKDKHVYVHHLFGYVFDRVKDLSEDEQHPSLNLPSTVESFPIVPDPDKKEEKDDKEDQ